MPIKSSDHFDVYHSITDDIIAAIEHGAGEFIMPWHTDKGSVCKPQNASTDMSYRGVNVLALWARAYLYGFTSGYWASYKQWNSLGAQVRAGARGTTIVFYRQLHSGEDTTADTENDRPRVVARATKVFNANQVDDWRPPDTAAAASKIDPHARADKFITGTGANLSHGGDRAFYNLGNDRIQLPERERFRGTATSSPTQAYYATALHEIVHWSGAAHRLARDIDLRDRQSLAAEELVAEIGAAFLCADLGVSNVPRPDHAAYVSNWLQLLRHDPRAVFTASRKASDAATYLHALTSR